VLWRLTTTPSIRAKTRTKPTLVRKMKMTSMERSARVSM